MTLVEAIEVALLRLFADPRATVRINERLYLDSQNVEAVFHDRR